MSSRPPDARDEAPVPFGAADVPAVEKPQLVRAVFDHAARRYDLMNDLMSLGVHRLWKEALVDWLDPQPGLKLLDLAGGTGDVAAAILRRTARKAARRDRSGAPALAVVCDINEAMLRAGLSREEPAGMRRLCGDAEALPLEAGRFDVVTMAFGIRNVTRMDQALAEIHRVLKPGGRFLCLEFSHVAIPGLERLYRLYSDRVIPPLGGLVTGNTAPYRYLVDSIRRFPSQSRFAERIREAGFSRVTWRDLSGGIAALHSGWRL